MLMTRVIHPFEPLFDEDSKILILGSFPSVTSREVNFYYGHKSNRFWKVMALVLDHPWLETVEEKKKMLLDHHVALWDVIESCEIKASSDASIKDVKVNDIKSIITKSKITMIACNGDKAYKLYERYAYPNTGIKAIRLPSTSSANASYSLERLVEDYKKITKLE